MIPALPPRQKAPSGAFLRSLAGRETRLGTPRYSPRPPTHQAAWAAPTLRTANSISNYTRTLWTRSQKHLISYMPRRVKAVVPSFEAMTRRDPCLRHVANQVKQPRRPRSMGTHSYFFNSILLSVSCPAPATDVGDVEVLVHLPAKAGVQVCIVVGQLRG